MKQLRKCEVFVMLELNMPSWGATSVLCFQCVKAKANNPLCVDKHTSVDNCLYENVCMLKRECMTNTLNLL